MTKSKNGNKKRGRKRGETELCSTSLKRQEEKKFQPISSVFKGEEIQEISGILGITELDDSQTLLGAVVLNKFDVVKKLLKDGFSIDSCKEDGITPLMWAVRLKHREMAELLIKRGANLNLEDKEGNTALMTAAYTKSWTQDLFIDLWNLVKDSGVNVNHINKTGNTMLHLVVKRNWKVVVNLITMVGANPNITTNKGVTPMMLACSRHQVNIMEALLAHSADLSLEDQKGCTACCYAIAYMIQKRIISIEFGIEEIISFMRSDNTKLSVKSYLKRRLELLQNPPEENFSKTICSVIVHVITFFMRFVLEGIAVLLQLNVFTTIKNAIEKHIEDNDYVISLVKILTEVVRYCECCTSHIPWDSVALAFNEAGIPCLCLRLLKRFRNSPSLHATFVPLFLTCNYPETKLWLQKNFKYVSHYYQQYIKIQSIPSEYNVYPDDAHSQMVQKFSLLFKQLMEQLQRGIIIQQEQRQPKKRKEKSLNHKKPIQHNLNFFKKNDIDSEKLSAVKLEDNKKLSNKEENIIVAVISNKKKEDMLISLEEEKSDTPVETYWSLNKINQVENKTEDEGDIEEELEENIVYPKWKEEFKEGCQLFGISVEENSYKMNQEIGSGDSIIQLSSNIEMESKISELEDLFDKVLNMYEIIWKLDFVHGYEECNSDIKDYLKLMYTLPSMEMYHWSQVTEKWKELCSTLRLKWLESRDKIVPDIKIYLESCTEGLNDTQFMKFQNEGNSVMKDKEINQQNSNYVISIEQFIRENQEEMHSKLKKEDNLSINGSQILPECETRTSNEVAEKDTRKDELTEVNENVQPSLQNYVCRERQGLSQENLLRPDKTGKQCCNSLTNNTNSGVKVCEDKKDIRSDIEFFQTKTSEEICFEKGHSITNPLIEINSEDSFHVLEGCKKVNNHHSSIIHEDLSELLEIWMITEIPSSPSQFPPPPTGFVQISKLKGIYQDKWRETDFVINRFSKLVTKLKCTRSILVKDIIMPPPHMQIHFLIGHGWLFGSTTLALDLNSGKPLVLKRLTQNESISLQMRSWKIHSLMRKLIYLHSGFLVPYTHCVDTKRFILLATPLCQRNINEHLTLHYSAGNFTRERAISLVRQAMRGLHYLHSQEPPIIHGSLKLTNLLIDARGNLRLADFGINEVMITCLSDVQMLGMLSHYILTGGLHPFGHTSTEISRSIMNSNPILRLDSHEALDITSWMLNAKANNSSNNEDQVPGCHLGLPTHHEQSRRTQAADGESKVLQAGTLALFTEPQSPPEAAHLQEHTPSSPVIRGPAPDEHLPEFNSHSPRFPERDSQENDQVNFPAEGLSPETP